MWIRCHSFKSKAKPKEISYRAAGTDSSDGLLEAVRNICLSSKCKAVLNRKTLPKSKDWPIGSHWDEWCLNGGEDFELIFSLPPKWAKEFLKEEPRSSKIGEIINGPSQVTWDTGEIIKTTNQEFQHF